MENWENFSRSEDRPATRPSICAHDGLSSTAEPFNYAPLNPTNWEIRLMRLLPLKDDGVISLELASVPLSDFRGRFRAISYTWGPEQPMKDILVGDRYFRVRKNIYSFFQHCLNVGKLTASDYIWVDSICINQNDISEKNIQVGMMKYVFSYATSVLVWLGTTSRESFLVNEFRNWRFSESAYKPSMDLLPRDHASHHRTSDKQELARLKGSWIDYLQQCVVSKSFDIINEELYAQLMNLLRNPYWERLWIVQECVLAKQVYILLGHHEIPIEIAHAMSLFRQNLLPSTNRELVAKDTTKTFMDMDPYDPAIISNIISHKNPTSPIRHKIGLLQVLSQFFRQLCEDPRDRVFGLLGFCSKGGELNTDYSLRPEEVMLHTLLLIYDEAAEDFGPSKEVVIFHSGIEELVTDRTGDIDSSIISALEPLSLALQVNFRDVISLLSNLRRKDTSFAKTLSPLVEWKVTITLRPTFIFRYEGDSLQRYDWHMQEIQETKSSQLSPRLHRKYYHCGKPTTKAFGTFVRSDYRIPKASVFSHCLRTDRFGAVTIFLEFENCHPCTRPHKTEQSSADADGVSTGLLLKLSAEGQIILLEFVAIGPDTHLTGESDGHILRLEPTQSIDDVVDPIRTAVNGIMPRIIRFYRHVTTESHTIELPEMECSIKVPLCINELEKDFYAMMLQPLGYLWSVDV
ncbi:uncharacterized protein HMPREF1541_03045 [Cyphellophora europaea CBS 101466]|uniref:Heterokaryon incompatibility domain-containing protein n=1 Tax=Cyphellophora europaea (strain CBS 101466) TaxID=1220924 RepID=W2RXR0_CYPE1|nr:uncharacterized protein HMPREF1541_03045 [Cyphellophora europaea CBS 101466]ETN41110.1 hypothetical protein HMPREF1541_03045 [Cyphellophora europaea CBS 101466]